MIQSDTDMQVREWIINHNTLGDEYLSTTELGNRLGIEKMDETITRVSRQILTSFGFPTSKAKSLTAQENIDIEVIKNLEESKRSRATLYILEKRLKKRLQIAEDENREIEIESKLQRIEEQKAELRRASDQILIKLKFEDRQVQKMNKKESEDQGIDIIIGG